MLTDDGISYLLPFAQFLYAERTANRTLCKGFVDHVGANGGRSGTASWGNQGNLPVFGQIRHGDEIRVVSNRIPGIIRPARERRDVFPTQTRQHYYTDFVCNYSASVLKWQREPYSQHKDI